MVASHPYNTWPLGAKLFTEDAVEAWKDANKALAGSLLPERFTVDVELEGVDGKSGNAGSGRTGPIDVTDGVSVQLLNRRHRKTHIDFH